MKKILACFVLAAMVVLLSFSAAASSDASLRVMTFNIHNSDDNESRFEAIKTTVGEIAPDVFGFQECREGFNTLVTDIKALGYASVVDTLVDDPDDSTIINCVPIFYDTDKYTLVANSAGARRFTEKYEESWTKSMCYCVLQDVATAQQFIVVNAHFAVYDEAYGFTAAEVQAQRVSNANEVLSQIESMQNTYGDLPVIAMGDFNADEPEKAYRTLLSELTDAAHISDKAEPFVASYHGALTEAETGGYPIDHIFVSGDDFASTACLPYVTETSRSASDHFPVYADLTFAEVTGVTCDETHTAAAPLVILDASKRSPYSDTLEGFTIMNVGTTAIDLSHVIAWYGRSDTEEGLDALEPSDVTKVMRLSSKRGENILQPGEKAYIWCIIGTAYKPTVPSGDGTASLVKEGSDGKPVYNVELFRSTWNDLAAGDTYDVNPFDEDILVIPLDRTTRDVFDENGDFRELAESFNIQNSYYVRLYLSYDNALDVSEAFCSVDLDSLGGGTYVNSSGEVASAMGMYTFVPSGNAAFLTKTYFHGGFTVLNVLTAVHNCINGNLDKVWDVNNDGVSNMIDIIRVLKAAVI